MKQITDILPNIPKPYEAIPLPSLALRAVTAKNNRTVYASSDKFYKHAEFGRDALEVAEDIMKFKPELAGNILLSHARLQGTVENDQNEESVGKSIHEFRSTIVDGKRISPDVHDIFNRLSFKWGGNNREVAYYGSVDATPLFVRTMYRYTRLYSTDILDKTVVLRGNQEKITLREAVLRAIAWTERQLDGSRSGLFEYMRRNPQGDPNQSWKDSEEAYVHIDGRMANHDAPVASIEVQALVYDALMTAAEIDHANANRYREKAAKLREKVFDLLWLDDMHYFALGIDYEKNSDAHPRIIKTPMANAATMLDSYLFDNLDEPRRQKYITAIIRQIFGKDFLTSVGIRSRSLAYAKLVPFWDYHGSYVSWPKETYDIAKGLRRQGFDKLSDQLENRLLNVVFKTRQYAEFFYVDDHGRILMHAPYRQPTKHHMFLVDSINTPETIQAWTVSAIYAIVYRRLDERLKGKRKVSHKQWEEELEKAVMAHIPIVNRIFNPLMLSSKYQTYDYQLKQPPRA